MLNVQNNLYSDVNIHVITRVERIKLSRVTSENKTDMSDLFAEYLNLENEYSCPRSDRQILKRGGAIMFYINNIFIQKLQINI